ncbi:UDP-glycosyltransferase UGT5-like [Episyrphus balteatus]|uniref:UDP-glycosyltransferase UGT5-like n=1 Tax=Episyrphus balteatus TaxID=286459 RepID=UPI002485CF12|nr:UDP-glycosyltransferase UGT5-like [Episyrphus balteatus]
MITPKILTLTFVALLVVSYTDAARILAAFVFQAKSHYMMHNVLIKELINRGHEVTFITSNSMNKNLGENYTEVLIDPVYNYEPDIKKHFNYVEKADFTSFSLVDFLKLLEIIGEKTTEHALKHPKVREIFNRNETHDVYDLLIVEQFYQEAFLALRYKYNIPVIASSTLGYENHMSQMMGLMTPWSYVPHGFLPFDDKMNYWERLMNTVASLYTDLYREFVYFPKQDALVKKYLSHLPVKIPKVSEMEKNVSLMLLNSYVPLTKPRPSMLGMIPVGGMHIYPANPLPADIKQFLDGATHGAIYFSLGSQVKSQNMPPEKLAAFLDVFRGMKQRVLWKFENDKITNLPKNVMIKKWMPQTDILAHPNVKVFITHGGLFGTQESVYHAVPMLGIPAYGDQFLNMKKATNAGYAKTLIFQDITKETLKEALTELIENPSFKKTAQLTSQIFRDRPECPRETAMYWVDYIIRYKGAPHIRSAGLDLAWYEFYLLDVIATLVFGVTVVVIFMYVAIQYIIGKTKIKEKMS